MGQTTSWICVKGRSRAEVLELTGLVETGEIDFAGDNPLVCAELPSGWVIVWSQHDGGFANPDRMSRLSAQGEAIGGESSESVMHSTAYGYRDGVQVWSVSHDPDAGLENLATEGAPPAQLAAIGDDLLRQRAEDEDGDVDHVFEAPMALSAAVSGFRPDQAQLPAQTVLEVVEPVRSGKAGEQQARAGRLNVRLRAAIEGQLYAAAQDLGFEPLLGHPAFHEFYPLGASNVFVRRRGEWSQIVEFQWGFSDGAPVMALEFFVRRGDTPRYGRSGRAHKPPAPLTLKERFTGRKLDPDMAIGALVEDGRVLLAALDRHLREDTPHPLIRPAEYRDDISPE